MDRETITAEELEVDADRMEIAGFLRVAFAAREYAAIMRRREKSYEWKKFANEPATDAEIESYERHEGCDGECLGCLEKLRLIARIRQAESVAASPPKPQENQGWRQSWELGLRGIRYDFTAGTATLLWDEAEEASTPATPAAEAPEPDADFGEVHHVRFCAQQNDAGAICLKPAGHENEHEGYRGATRYTWPVDLSKPNSNVGSAKRSRSALWSGLTLEERREMGALRNPRKHEGDAIAYGFAHMYPPEVRPPDLGVHVPEETLEAARRLVEEPGLTPVAPLAMPPGYDFAVKCGYAYHAFIDDAEQCQCGAQTRIVRKAQPPAYEQHHAEAAAMRQAREILGVATDAEVLDVLRWLANRPCRAGRAFIPCRTA